MFPHLVFCLMSRMRLKVTFLLLGGGMAEPSGGLADTVYMESRR